MKKVRIQFEKVLAFFAGLWYHKSRSIGQAAKTSPSHGENKGSIPLSTAAEHFGVLLFFYTDSEPHPNTEYSCAASVAIAR